MNYVAGLLGGEARQWEFGQAIVRNGHVSALFVRPGVNEDGLELWISATDEGPGGWLLQHSELPELRER